MDLSDFIGQTVEIGFYFGSDGGTESNRFYFDDLRIEYTLRHPAPKPFFLRAFTCRKNEPNPAFGHTLIQWDGDENTLGDKADLLVFNTLGKLVIDQPFDLSTEKNVVIDTRGLAPGIYLYLLRSAQGQSQAMKMSVAR